MGRLPSSLAVGRRTRRLGARFITRDADACRFIDGEAVLKLILKLLFCICNLDRWLEETNEYALMAVGWKSDAYVTATMTMP